MLTYIHENGSLPFRQMSYAVIKGAKEQINEYSQKIFNSSVYQCVNRLPLKMILGSSILVGSTILVVLFLKIFFSEEKPEPFFKEKKFPIDSEFYIQLKAITGEDASTPFLYVTDENGGHKEELVDHLGRGGSKIAVLLENSRALLLPNLSVSNFIGEWERQVCEEVGMSTILTSLGLLCSQLEEVKISLTEDSKTYIPAYTCETFESLGTTKNWFIIDTKNRDSSTWKEKFFKNDDDNRLKEESWNPIFDPLLTDIAKLCIHGIPTSRDSQNLAIIKNPDSVESKTANYEVRYFGFDFSSKNQPLCIPKKASTSCDHTKKVQNLLSNALETVLDVQFSTNKFSFSFKYPEDLYKSLMDKYTKIIHERIKKLSEL